tara:strand:- start:508 stop:729 length:222 start_codon:yes stop_codon:yes gene_type:complete
MDYRLVYKDNKVYALHHSSGTTETLKNLSFFNTLDECFNEIDVLKLEFIYFSGNTTKIIFSGGSRTIEDINDL